MGKDKLKRFEENKSFPSLYQPEFNELFRRDYEMKGKWASDHFKNDNPIVLELGCGRGEYTVALSRMNTNKNYIGVDIKGARMWRGAKTVTEEGITNAAFLRCRIEFIESAFDENEVSEIWITFPDPQVKRENKRLTSPSFIDRYRNLLKLGGLIHLKTDNSFLYEYTLELVNSRDDLTLIEANNDIYGTGRADKILSVKTRYESQFLATGMKIHLLSFSIK